MTILNEYSSNNKASKYVKQKLIKMKGEIHEFTIDDN